MTEHYLIRIRHNDEVVASAPLMLYDKEKALEALRDINPWSAITVEGIRALIENHRGCESHGGGRVSLAIGLEIVYQGPEAVKVYDPA